MKKYKNIICVLLVVLVFAGMTVAVWASPASDYSDDERRPLAQFPELSIKTLLDGSFMEDFNKYTQDQFPLRGSMLDIKTIVTQYVLGQLDENNVYIKDGYATKMEYPLNEENIDYAASRFEYIYNKYLAKKNTKVYLSVIPDKSYFFAQSGGYFTMDHEKLIALLREKTDAFADYIDIIGTLELTDYYKTDTHWRQEKLPDTAAALAAGMGVTLSGKYTEQTLEYPFYGVHYNQSVIPLKAETMYYLTNDIIDSMKVSVPETKWTGGVYNMDKAAGKDPYEMFLSGSVGIATIENPNATVERELIVFRDSFGSSITPLLAEGYSKVTLVDIRYIMTDNLGWLVDFENCDVLFLYSTLVLNNADTLT